MVVYILAVNFTKPGFEFNQKMMDQIIPPTITMQLKKGQQLHAGSMLIIHNSGSYKREIKLDELLNDNKPHAVLFKDAYKYSDDSLLHFDLQVDNYIGRDAMVMRNGVPNKIKVKVEKVDELGFPEFNIHWESVNVDDNTDDDGVEGQNDNNNNYNIELINP
jgi:hypothetical protein